MSSAVCAFHGSADPIEYGKQRPGLDRDWMYPTGTDMPGVVGGFQKLDAVSLNLSWGYYRLLMCLDALLAQWHPDGLHG